MAGGGGGARGSDRAVAARSPTTTTAIQSTIQSIKEVVGGHSDADILDTFHESNMDPNETAQKLLNQGFPHLSPVPPIWVASTGSISYRRRDVHVVEPKLWRLLKADMVAVFLELTAQGEALLALQEILYQLIQGSNGSSSSRTHSTPSCSYGHDRTSNELKSSGDANYELQLAVDEALARELQEMEGKLANTSLYDNNGRKPTLSSVFDRGNNSASRPPLVVEEDGIDPDNMTYEGWGSESEVATSILL